MNSTNKNPVILSTNQFPVIGIGASAGGLNAFIRFIKAIPADSGMAYVLVQHLSPNHDSLLSELLQKVTGIPVHEISDDVKVFPDHIYILPSNKMLVANDGVLQLSPRPVKSRTSRNLPIDLFFRSLAEVHQSHAIGIVLSGTASDGTLGLKAIKDHGGITFAQDEASAEYDSMPRNAVQAGVVDFILPPEDMPQKLIDIKQQIIPGTNGQEDASDANEKFFKQIVLLLRVRKGTDFTYYKQSTVRRRILRRIALSKVGSPQAYLTELQQNKKEQDALYQDLLIPVTSFFRDQKVFDNLCATLFPHILKDKKENEFLRIWVASCSTGQEAYSIAICLKEYLGSDFGRIQIFATDISEPAIQKARTGTYTKSELEAMSPHRLQEFFVKTGDGYQLNKEVRNMCVFATHNFLKDPPFGKMDFVSCRNALIYMEPYLQKKALTTFHYALNPGGYLLLGKSETISSTPELFNAAVKHDKLFTRKNVPGRFIHVASQRNEQSLHELNHNPANENSNTDFQTAADEIILSQYSPVGVVVNESMDIVQFRGNTSDYLQQSSGKPSHNLIKMAKDGLAFELRNILHKVKKDNRTIKKENILIQVNNLEHLISLEALLLPNMEEPHYLVMFHKQQLPEIQKETSSKKSLASAATGAGKDLHILQLKNELDQTRDDMRSITEEQEAANEELQSANEELLSGSEELQSLNEELETSKEELQSTNEELTVLNAELYHSNEELSVAREYAEAIITTLPEPLLVLNKRLKIIKANGSFYKTFHVSEKATEGALIYDLENQQWNIPSLKSLLEDILPKKPEVEDYEVSHYFVGTGERVMLINAREIIRKTGEDKLILLVIRDITERKQHQQKEKELLTRFKNLVEQAPVAMCIFSGEDFMVNLANESYLQLVGKGRDFINKPIFDSLPELKGQGMKKLLEDVIFSGEAYYGNEVELVITRGKKKEKGSYNFVYQPMHDGSGIATGVIIVATDVTEQVMARKKMEVQAAMVQNLLMTAPGFICTLRGPDHVYELVNERYQQLFGRRKIKGKPILKALPELEGQGFNELLDNVYNTGLPYVGIDIPLTTGRDIDLEPELRYFNFSYQPMFDVDKNIYSILVFGYEVTKEVIAKNKILNLQQKHSKELEDKVQQRTLELSEANDLLVTKNEELIKMNAELESFTYISSHDLQEPLRKIQSFATRILETEFSALSDTGKDYFGRMHKAAKRMQTLIEDLLTYSHTGISERTFQKTDLAKMAEEVKNDFADLLLEKNATIEFKGVGEANINPSQFRQLLDNMMSNSLKFAKPGISLKLIITNTIASGIILQSTNPGIPKGKLAAGDSYCHIQFSDNGIGFDNKYRNKIFEVFQRLHGKDAYTGTGIGLAIVKKIIENHNGVITATGIPGGGATFDMYIPL
ncbi:MAG: PAS domain-containing protein [Ferruginibacter sp.]|nr:PAS domain-containing protein [Ferruginibacter sp.]